MIFKTERFQGDSDRRGSKYVTRNMRYDYMQ